jgi:hypothetical protein
MVDVDQPTVIELPWQVGAANPQLAGQADVTGRNRLRLLSPLPGLEGGNDGGILGPGFKDPAVGVSARGSSAPPQDL